MKSIVYGPHGNPVWKEQKRQPQQHRPLRENQVLVRVHAVGLNPVDAKGVIGDKLPHSWKTIQSWARRCCVQSKVIGFDFAGVVAETSPRTTSSPSFAVGDRVYGILPPSRYEGSLQEYIQVSTDQIAHLPNNDDNGSSSSISLRQAAALPLVGLTAFQCLQGAGWGSSSSSQPQQQPQQGQSSSSKRSLLVIGASGGTGHVAVQIGRCMQPQGKIVAVCSGRNKEFCQHLAPNVIVLDYRADDFVQQLRASGPFDVVMDCVTSGDPRDQSALDYGKLMWEENENEPSLLTPTAQYRRLGGVFPDWFKAGAERVAGIQLWSNPRAKLFWIQMHQAAPALQQIANWWADGSMKLGAHVSKTVPFTPEGVQKGFDALLGRRVTGKVVVQVVEDEKDSPSQPREQQESDSPSHFNLPEKKET